MQQLSATVIFLIGIGEKVIRFVRILEYECEDEATAELVMGANNFVPLNGVKRVGRKLTIRSATIFNLEAKNRESLVEYDPFQD